MDAMVYLSHFQYANPMVGRHIRIKPAPLQALVEMEWQREQVNRH
jgi:hypothetical protein